MEWVINLLIFYFLTFLFWNHRKYNPVHIIWVPPAAFILVLILGIVFGALFGGF